MTNERSIYMAYILIINSSIVFVYSCANNFWHTILLLNTKIRMTRIYTNNNDNNIINSPMISMQCNSQEWPWFAAYSLWLAVCFLTQQQQQSMELALAVATTRERVLAMMLLLPQGWLRIAPKRVPFHFEDNHNSYIYVYMNEAVLLFIITIIR